jgi:hypothetical protein
LRENDGLVNTVMVLLKCGRERERERFIKDKGK